MLQIWLQFMVAGGKNLLALANRSNMPYIITAIAAYLLGSIPFGYIMVRIFRGEDVRQTGSGNIGATNVARSAPILGLVTLILDAGKGLLAVLAGRMLAISFNKFPPLNIASTGRHLPSIQFAALAAVFAILGHLFPVWLKFRGGKGVATSTGIFIALAPKALLIAMLMFTALLAAFRYVSLGSIIAVAAFPLIAYLTKDYQNSPAILAAMCAIAILIIAKHHANIRRLLARTEPPFEFKRTRV